MVEIERRRKRFEARQVTAEDLRSADRLREVAKWASDGSSESSILFRIDPVATCLALRVWPRTDHDWDWTDVSPGDWLVKRRKRVEVLSAEEFERSYVEIVPPAMEASPVTNDEMADEAVAGPEVLAINLSKRCVYFMYKSELMGAILSVMAAPGGIPQLAPEPVFWYLRGYHGHFAIPTPREDVLNEAIAQFVAKGKG